jgi:hypothetical protein
MYPSGLSPDEAIRGSLARASLFPRFTTMVSAGLAGAHVQPVLEKQQLLASKKKPLAISL